MRHGPLIHRRHAGGLTLLEVLVAVTILALVGTAIVLTMSTATRSYDRSVREGELLQRARYVFDTLDRDLGNIHYRDETSYNFYMSSVLQNYESERMMAELNDDWTQFERRYGPRDKNSDGAHVGNPFDLAPLIDLGFRGGRNDVTFVRAQPSRLGERRFPMGLARVKYEVSNGVLVRSLDSAEEAPRDWEGQPVQPETAPDHDIVAEGVAELELRYAFWYDSQWYETDQWDSANRLIRNPRATMAEHDSRGVERVDGQSGLTPGQPGWNPFLNSQQNEPLDRLPAYVRIKLGLKDPKNDKTRIRRFERIVRVPAAVETYTLLEEFDEEHHELEREARDEKYLPFFPGAMWGEEP